MAKKTAKKQELKMEDVTQRSRRVTRANTAGKELCDKGTVIRACSEQAGSEAVGKVRVRWDSGAAEWLAPDKVDVIKTTEET